MTNRIPSSSHVIDNCQSELRQAKRATRDRREEKRETNKGTNYAYRVEGKKINENENERTTHRKGEREKKGKEKRKTQLLLASCTPPEEKRIATHVKQAVVF